MNNTCSKIYLPTESKGEMKYIYGTYAEMAFHNLYSTIDHIYTLVFKESLKAATLRFQRNYNPEYEEWQLDDFGNKALWNTAFHDLQNGKPEEKAKAIKLMRKHFPFLEPMLDYARKRSEVKHFDSDAETFRVLHDMMIVLREMRNEYAHFKIVAKPDQIKSFVDCELFIINGLKNTYDGSKRVVKDRFSFSENDMKPYDRLKVENDFSRRDKYGKPSKKVVERTDYKYRIDTVAKQEGTTHFSVYGVLSFLSLFLEKKYIQIFADKLHCINRNDKKFIVEMLAVYRLHLPVNKLSCEKDANALGLDMLNELRKCPKELFELLPPERQEEFRVDVEGEEDGKVLMMRHSDRFAYFAMRYIDAIHALDNAAEGVKIRFQLALGKYFYKFYNKRCIDSTSADRVRSLQKDLNGFGILTDVDKKREEVWGNFIRRFEDVHQNTENEKPYITDHHANYVMNGNRIGMRIMQEGEEMLLPELNENGVRCVPPTCWLSTYELPALILLTMMDKTKPATIIAECVNTYKRLFTDISEGKLIPQNSKADVEAILTERYNGIKFCDIPKNMQNYLTKKNIDIRKAFNKWAAEFIDQLIEQTEYKLDKFDDQSKTVSHTKDNKIGKKRYVEIKPGHLAEFLARDIMFFQPVNKDNSNKLTGLNYQVLQSALATFQDGNIDSIVRMLGSAHIINNVDASLNHPFLAKVVRGYRTPRNINELYKQYLQERKQYLQIAKRNISGYAKIHFLHANQSKWAAHNEQFYRALASRYLKDEYCGTEFDKPIELPRGLFENEIRKQLRQLNNAKLNVLAADNTKNVAYLIYAYFMNAKEDDAQTFYNYPRCYPLFNTLGKKGRGGDDFYKSMQEIYELYPVLGDVIEKHVSGVQLSYKDRISLAEKQQDEREKLRRQAHVMRETEKIIRRYKVQDTLVFLMAESLLFADTAGVDKQGKLSRLSALQLKDIAESNVLSEKMPFFAVTVTSRRGWTKTVYQENLKLKNYSQFYRFLYDRRIPTLFDMTMEKNVERQDIERELEAYDRVHPEILKTTFEIEKAYYKEHPEVSYAKFSEIVNSDESLSDDEAKRVSNIRNSFSHVSYPTSVYSAKKENLPNKAITIKDVYNEHLGK